jgi:hypothetical protein
MEGHWRITLRDSLYINVTPSSAFLENLKTTQIAFSDTHFKVIQGEMPSFTLLLDTN